MSDKIKELVEQIEVEFLEQGLADTPIQKAVLPLVKSIESLTNEIKREALLQAHRDGITNPYESLDKYIKSNYPKECKCLNQEMRADGYFVCLDCGAWTSEASEQEEGE